jgi:hypothetical protein
MKSIWQSVTSAALLATRLLLLAESIAESPLPSLATVLKRVADQTEKESDNERAFNQRYGYTRTKVTEYRNANGDLKKREEKINGRPMLMLEFKPAKKDLPERNIKDRFINKAAGRVWVDEADYVIAKADVYLTETVNIVGGLVGAVWKFNYSFDRERTSDGLWFTRAVDWHLEGREVILRRAIHYHEGKTGVRKAWQEDSRKNNFGFWGTLTLTPPARTKPLRRGEGPALSHP